MLPKTEKAIIELGKSKINVGNNNIPIVFVKTLPKRITVPSIDIPNVLAKITINIVDITPSIPNAIGPNTTQESTKIINEIIKLFEVFFEVTLSLVI